MTASRLDSVAVERLRRVGGDRLLVAMLDSFVEHGALRVRAAREAAAAADAAALAAAAHSLKSSAGNVGAAELRELAGGVEREASARVAEESLERQESLVLFADQLAGAFAHAARLARELREECSTGDV